MNRKALQDTGVRVSFRLGLKNRENELFPAKGG